MPPIAPILAASNLLSRMHASAERAGDLGRAWVLAAVRRLTGQAIARQRAAAGEAKTIGVEVATAERLIARSLADDGVIDRREARLIRASLRPVRRHCSTLVRELDLPEVSS